MSEKDKGLRPEHYREMAEELRSIADGMLDPKRAETVRKIADDYERMGRTKEKLDASATKLDKKEG